MSEIHPVKKRTIQIEAENRTRVVLVPECPKIFPGRGSVRSIRKWESGGSNRDYTNHHKDWYKDFLDAQD